ncbi:MAG: hypothetical protein Q9O74_06640 [Planctomycetota bacterium]|nr:hypothetical protein [Planctomycetota bacterium]
MERVFLILRTGALVLLIALAALLVGGYSFGTDDQAQYLVQVLLIEHPEALPNDAYPPVFDALGSFFWYPVAWLSSESSRAAVLLGLALAIAMLNVELLRRLGKTLIGTGTANKTTVGVWALVPALLLVVPKERNWFGLVGVADHELTATMGVLPLVFGAMLAWTRGRVWIALLLCAAAVPIHAQTGAALLVTWWVGWAAIALRGIVEPRTRMVSAVVAGVVGVVGLVAVVLARQAMALPAQTRALCRAAGDDLFAELIDPLTATPEAWASVGAVLLLGLVAAVRSGVGAEVFSRARSGARRSVPDPVHLLLVWCVASLVFPVVGTALHALGVEDPLLWRLMVGRGFLLPQLGAIVLVACWCSRSPGGVGAVLTAVVLLVLAWWPFAGLPVPVAAGLLGLVVLAMLARPVKATGRAASHFSDVAPRSDAHPAPRLVLAAAVPVVILAVLGIGSARWLDTHANPAWREAQTWARANTAPDALFITPPYLSGWRLESHRTTFGEGKDGGLAFYADDRVLDWSRRMDLVGLGRPCDWDLWEAATTARAGPSDHVEAQAAAREAYHAALRTNLYAIRSGFDATHLVTEADLGLGEVVWHNDRFWISRLGPMVDSKLVRTGR